MRFVVWRLVFPAAFVVIVSLVATGASRFDSIHNIAEKLCSDTVHSIKFSIGIEIGYDLPYVQPRDIVVVPTCTQLPNVRPGERRFYTEVNVYIFVTNQELSQFLGTLARYDSPIELAIDKARTFLSQQRFKAVTEGTSENETNIFLTSGPTPTEILLASDPRFVTAPFSLVSGDHFANLPFRGWREVDETAQDPIVVGGN